MEPNPSEGAHPSISHELSPEAAFRTPPMPQHADALVAAYKALVIEGTSHPTAVDIAARAGLTEADFFATFSTPEAVGQYAWEQIFERLQRRVQGSSTFQSYSAREKMLAYNFTFFELALADRSFICATYERWDLTKTYAERFKALHAEWVSEGVAMDELRERLSLSSQYPAALWALHVTLIRFWAQDTSDQFQQTERAIEVFSKVPLELMGTNIIDSTLDTIKFAFEQFKPQRLAKLFGF